jgi:hypothetical protein
VVRECLFGWLVAANSEDGIAWDIDDLAFCPQFFPKWIGVGKGLFIVGIDVPNRDTIGWYNWAVTLDKFHIGLSSVYCRTDTEMAVQQCGVIP